MSWDIFVQDLPAGVATVAEIPDEFMPQNLGSRSHIVSKIREVIPDANFSDPAWGKIDGDDWSIEVNIGDSETCTGFAFHVRGGDQAMGAVDAILRTLGLRAIDSQTGEFFVAGPVAKASFERWRELRDSVIR